jgi:NitT/TauT family transport system permease protein
VQGRSRQDRTRETLAAPLLWGWMAIMRLLPFAVVIVAWHLLHTFQVVSPALLPSPRQVLDAGVRLFQRGVLTDHMIASTTRVLLGVIIGVGMAIPVGFALGWFPAVRRFMDPLINFFRALPPIALVPLVVVYVGIGENGRLFVLVYASFFPATVVIYEGITAIESIFVRAAQVLGANGFELFRKVVFPFTVPHILTAFRVALGVAWATLVAAELVAARTGLGAMIQDASNFFQIPVIFLGIIVIGAIALLMDAVVRTVVARFVAWRD